MDFRADGVENQLISGGLDGKSQNLICGFITCLGFSRMRGYTE
jgi:hypothetical protein